MQIEYKILWLDDQIESFIDDEYVDEIKEFLEKEGFEASIDTVDNASDFFQKLNDTYDLILTDYHMSEKNGDEVVRETRNRCKVLSEILFYTARADLKDIIKLDRISFLQTNSSGATHQKTVIQKIKDLISLTIQKFHDIVVMRGMIMNETSDMDNQKLDMIKQYILSETTDKTNELKNEILSTVNEHFTKKLKYVNGDWKTKDKGFNNLMKDTFVFSADYKIKTLGWILNDLGINDFSDDYKTEIINIRNKFAHANLEIDSSNGRKYFKHGADGITFDEVLCKKIRMDIIKHKNNLKDLKNKLNG